MIAKCVALLAAVAQISCYTVSPSCGTPIIASGTALVGSSVGATTRNIVAKGKFPITLENTGPLPDPRIQVSTSHLQAPLQEKPIVRLPAKIPAPKTVAHTCTCYKQILRPRVHDQYISVPTVQRYIETTHTPVVENIQYEAVPINDPSTYSTSGAVFSGELAPAAAPIEAVPVSSGIEVVPVSSGYVAPVATSFPVRALSTGCSQVYY